MMSQNKTPLVLEDRLSGKELKVLGQLDERVNDFCSKVGPRQIILITSGGTSVPLEKNVVRFIENHSTGTRGSKLAEHALHRGMAVIFFYRDKSFQPFLRDITPESLFRSQSSQILQKITAAKQQLAKYEQNILFLPFETIYLYLNGILRLKQLLPAKAIILLCAAVSDFIPQAVATHKIQTSQSLSLQLTSSPKILGLMVDQRHLTVSFKLETDVQKIGERMQFAIDKYNVDMVVGNILGNATWIRMQFNHTVFPDRKNIEVEADTEMNIISMLQQLVELKYQK